MSTTTTEHSALVEHPVERPSQDRKEPTYLFSEKQVMEKSEIARRFLDARMRLNNNVDKANNFLVKRFYNIDHNAYLEGALLAKTKELMGLVASACLRCDDCIFYHAIHASPGCDASRAGRVVERRPGCRRQHRHSAPAARLRAAGRAVWVM